MRIVGRSLRCICRESGNLPPKKSVISLWLLQNRMNFCSAPASLAHLGIRQLSPSLISRSQWEGQVLWAAQNGHEKEMDGYLAQKRRQVTGIEYSSVLDQALEEAVIHRHPECVSALIRAQKRELDCPNLTHAGIHQAFKRAIILGEIESLDVIINGDFKLTRLELEKGVLLAAREGQTGCLKVLLEKFGKQHTFGLTALRKAALYACEEGHLECLQYMRSYNEKIDGRAVNDRECFNAAIKNNQIECVRWLIEVAHDKIPLSELFDMIYDLSHQGYHENLKAILFRYKDRVGAQVLGKGLIAASRMNQLECFKLFLLPEFFEKLEIHPIEEAFFLAVKYSHPIIVQSLLSNQYVRERLSNAIYIKALSFASEDWNTCCFTLLIKNIFANRDQALLQEIFLGKNTRLAENVKKFASKIGINCVTHLT